MELREERPAYVSFSRKAVEDKAASLAAGHYVAKDVDYVHVTPAYTKDVFDQKVSVWFAQKEADVNTGRFPQQWLDMYKAQYQAWLKGQSLPLNGIPIRGWGVISPAQQETLTRLNILTVEDLSLVNQDGLRMIGPGSLDLKNKAIAWLAELKDKGGNTMEIAALKSENKTLRESVENMQKQIADLVAAIPQTPAINLPVPDKITSSDIIDDPVEAYTAKFGKPPHHRMKEETIRAALEG